MTEKQRKAETARYNKICICGHKSGRHWYYILGAVGSHDCRDCKCKKFQEKQND